MIMGFAGTGEKDAGVAAGAISCGRRDRRRGAYPRTSIGEAAENLTAFLANANPNRSRSSPSIRRRIGVG
jgi:hypothetical protein